MKKALIIMSVFAVGVFMSIGQTQKNNGESIPSQLATIIEACRKKDPTPSHIRCFAAESTQKLIQTYGTQRVMEGLAVLFATRPSVGQIATVSCHDFAHVVGELAVNSGLSVGEAMAQCTGQCSYGCIHGALLTAVRKDPSLADNPAPVCEPLYTALKPQAQIIACQHGVGHGIAELMKLEVNLSLARCDRFASDDARFDCGRGVFMEIIDSPVLSHPPQTINGDIVSYCNRFSGMYKGACFANVGSRTFATSQDWPGAVAACMRVDTRWKDMCMSYLGQHVYFALGASASGAYDRCKNAGETGVGSCTQGVLEAIAYYHRTTHVQELCDGVGKYQQACYEMYGQKLLYIHGVDHMQKACSDFASPQDTYCLGSNK